MVTATTAAATATTAAATTTIGVGATTGLPNWLDADVVNGTNGVGLIGRDEVDFGMAYVHSHWLQYKDVIESAPHPFMYTLGVFITCVGITGIFGNTAVIWTFLRTASLRTPTNLLVVNLAICDLSFSAVNGFPLMAISCFYRRWIWGTAACQFYAYATSIAGLGSINNLAAISFDRYLVIARPFKSWKIPSKKRSLLLIAISWIWAIIWATPPMMGWSRYIPEGFGVSCTFDYLTRTPKNIAFNYCLVGFGFVQQLILIMFCYIGIIRAVARNRQDIKFTMNEESGFRGRLEEQREERVVRQGRQELQIAKVVAFSVVTFIVCWLPYAIITILGINGLDRLVTPYTTELPVMFAKTSAIWNPIIYALSHPKYRAALARLRPRFRRSCHGTQWTTDDLPVEQMEMNPIAASIPPTNGDVRQAPPTPFLVGVR